MVHPFPDVQVSIQVLETQLCTSQLGQGSRTANMKLHEDKSINVLETTFNFKDDSKLKKVTETGTSMDSPDFTLLNLLKFIKNFVSENNMFDPQNPTIIILNGEMEEALGIKALHVEELREMVAKHLFSVTGDMPRIRTWFQPEMCWAPQVMTDLPNLTGLYLPHPPVASDNHDYIMDNNFRQVLGELHLGKPKVNEEGHLTYKVRVVLRGVSSYILAKKTFLFDDRHKFVCLVMNDPLGTALEVGAFHRCQLAALVMRKLKRVKDSHGSQVNAARLIN